MPRPRSLLLFALGLMFALTATAQEKPATISFVQLPEHDRLVICFEFSGCFAYDAAEFVYDPRGKGRFEVTELVPDRSAPGPRRQFLRLPLGHVSLDDGEKARLDALLAHYRHPPLGPPDTLTLIGPAYAFLMIEHRSHGTVIARESLQDPQLPPPRPVLTFEAMFFALKQARGNSSFVSAP